MQLKFLFLLPLVFVTSRATPSDHDSENQCRLEVRCDGNKQHASFPSNCDDNRPLAIGKAGPKGLPGQKGEPGSSAPPATVSPKLPSSKRKFCSFPVVWSNKLQTSTTTLRL